MPWARIPCDRLATIGLFGYQFEHEDGCNLWYRGPDGEPLCVDRHAPRFWFDSVSDAMQAGCAAVKISSVEDGEEMARIEQEHRQALLAAQQAALTEGPAAAQNDDDVISRDEDRSDDQSGVAER